MKLQSKLLVLFLFLTMSVLCVVGVQVYILTKNEIISLRVDQLTNIAEKQKQKINVYLQKILEEHVGLVNLFEFRQALNGYNQSHNQEYVARLKQSISAFKLEEQGHGIYIYGVDGTVITQNDEAEISQAELDVYRNNACRDKKICSIPNTIVTIEPVYYEGRILGTVYMFHPIDELYAIVSDYEGLGKTGETILAQYLDEEKKIAQLITPIRTDPTAALTRTIIKEGASIPPVLFALEQQEKSFIDTKDYRSIPVLAATNYIDLASWGLVVKMDKEEALQSLQKFQWSFLLTFILALCGTLILSLFFSRSIISPLQMFTRAVNSVASGGVSENIRVEGKDEIADLSRSFIIMRDKIKNYQDHMEQEIVERTKELSDAKLLLEEKIHLVEEQNIKAEKSKLAMVNILEDEKKVEAALEEAKKNIETKVEERTRELLEEKVRLAASISSLPIGFVMVNTAGTVLFINDMALKILETERDTAQSIDDIVRLFPKDSPFEKLHKNYQDSKVVGLKVATIDFKTKILQVSLIPITTTAGHTSLQLGSIILFDDITEAKMLERSRDEFFSIASHELRTPLTAIRGNTSMMIDMYADALQDKPDMLEMVNDTHESSIRLIRIVNDFLNVSRLEMGKLEYKKAPIDVLVLAKEVIDEYATLGNDNNIGITIVTPKTVVPAVIGDKDKVKEILINLVGNALKFTSAGSITFSFFVDGASVQIHVTDTGRGIALENQSLLFRKFQQTGDNLFTRDTTKGTGLGLYISKFMAEGMGGTVYLVKSDSGKGSTFALTLPIAS